MNHKLVAKILGAMLVIEGVALMVPTLYAAATGEDALAGFVVAVLCCFGIGVPMAFLNTTGLRMQRRDGFACVGLCWILLGAVGALPYVISGTVTSYVDALFEAISGFTTTGASILTAVEGLPNSILLWRSMTNWMGGMGVLVMLLALLPKLGDGSANLMRAESPGPVMSKLVPRVADTAKILYIIYIGLTVSEVIVLCMLGMPLFDSINHSFATIATGGFSIKNASIGYYQSDAITWAVTIFMFLSGINFSLLYMALRRRWRDSVSSEELWLYAGTALASTTLITIDLVRETGISVTDAISDAAFQSMTVMSTTGFATADFAAWPAVSQCVLIMLMFMGGCAGSTAGGVKSIRFLLLFKNTQRWLHCILHPREVKLICVDGKRTEESTMTNVACFFFAYMMILMTCTMIIGLDKVDFLEAFSAALSALSNVGPALGSLGPNGNFAALNDVSKLTMSAAMLLGRLEIVPLAILLMPSVWRRK